MPNTRFLTPAIGFTVALVLALVPNSATDSTGILSLVALAYAVGLICLRAQDSLPSWATPAALALATILVTYAVEFFASPVAALRSGYSSRRPRRQTSDHWSTRHRTDQRRL